MKIEIWSDVICPWCYVGKRRLEAAIEQFDHGAEVEVVWHSYELNPNAPVSSELDLATGMARKFGVSVDEARAMNDHMTELAARDGLDFDLGNARPGNTFDAHRLIHLAAQRGLQGALKERFLAAYFTEGAAVSDHDTLARLAVSVGLDAREVAVVLAGTAYADEVRADEEHAMDLGVSGVPFFVIDGRFAVPGAQSTDLFLDTLERAWRKAHPIEVLQPAQGVDDGGGACTDDSCVI
jgi:predicted DsbA family dithiol-disulfide isomerase